MRQKISDALLGLLYALAVMAVAWLVNLAWMRSLEGLALATVSGLGGGLIAAVMRIRELKRERAKGNVQESIQRR